MRRGLRIPLTEVTQMPGPLNNDERGELERLRAENTELRQGGKRGGWRHGWRTPVAVLLIVIGSVLAPVSVIAVWAANQISNTDRYVANVAPLISQPPIQRELTDKITNTITAQLNVQQTAKQAATALSDRGLTRVATLLNNFSGPLSGAVGGFIHSQVARLVASPRAAALWTQLNRTAHAGLVRALSGSGGGAIDIQNGQVVASLGPFIKQAQTQLSDQGFTLVSKIPPVNPSITLFSARELTRAQTAYRAVNRLKYLLPLAAALCWGLGIYIARNHRRALLGAALGLVAGMFVLGAALAIARSIYLNSVPSSVLSSDAAAALYDTMVRFIKEGLRILLVFGLIVAAVAFFLGPSGSARRIRAWVSATLSRLGRSGALSSPQAERTGRWTYAHRTGLRVGSAAVAALIFVFWPSAVTAIVLAVILLLALGVIELLSRARASEHVAASPGGS